MASATTEDWQLNKSVLESNKHVLENQLYCDVTFVFNEDKAKKPHVSITRVFFRNLISRLKAYLVARPAVCSVLVLILE